METTRFDSLARALNEGRSRRGLLGLIAGSGMAWLGLDAADAKKKRKNKKKKKCGKPGKTPIKGRCCAGSILVDGMCQRCTVCARGCAFASIQEAIDDANSADTIVICPGTYEEDLLILKALRLIGAGNGEGAGDTILQGTGLDSVVLADSTDLILENLRITGGRGNGGGLNNDGSTVELIGCVVSGNTTPNAGVGGGIRNRGVLTLRNSTVSENTSLGGGQGGGIFNTTNSTAGIDAASRITGNTATNGGGIYNQVGTVILASTAIVSDNTPNNCSGDAIPNCIG